MRPTYDQLTNFCDSHNIVLQRCTGGVRATAYDQQNRPITTVMEVVEEVEKNRVAEEVAGLKVCDSIAEELLIVKPSVAFRLNL